MQNYWAPKKIIGFFGIAFTFMAATTSYVGANSPILILNENQILYLFSTSAQVLAGVYGLTLTGFIFFRNELSREEIEDETLVEAVESLKSRYFTLLLFVTLSSVVTLLLSNLAMSYEGTGTSFSAIIINSAQSAFVMTLLAVTYFIFEVISPKRIERESRKLQSQVDPSREEANKGSLEEFLKNYNQIEGIIAKYGSIYQTTSSIKYTNRPRRNFSNAKLTEMLFRNEKISESLYGEIRDLITLRNSIIHGAEPVVSDHVVINSSTILSELQKELELGN
ncbi:hypothetical protein SAMN05444507_105101 [Pseudomonas syringae]|uniref:RiboL-PSP-HEPN domain-containing protein n=1 Tax=Pseudomonas syringae pv. syringae TaxID=321 RepID=A0AAE5VSF7_PSESY|nr:hypothetical protein [Pseudomonas syringae]ALU61827.1 hypothetical protein ACA40_18895 [Pseudomonas syringae pv. lapsa]MBS7419472.1 hypothetical protein [Pseudomonas syringae]POQ01654.1 hypothetical protein CXB42_21055 [Pseudomonas syringae pv. syringae]SFI05482.1 hypothetical protein SAMN05444507_105101 [Pseudomonas syringae]